MAFSILSISPLVNNSGTNTFQLSTHFFFSQQNFNSVNNTVTAIVYVIKIKFNDSSHNICKIQVNSLNKIWFQTKHHNLINATGLAFECDAHLVKI